MRSLRPAALLALLAHPLAAQTPPLVTRDQAVTLPPEQLADIVLRRLGSRVTSVTRPGPGPLRQLVLATAPRATDVVGLCSATRIEVEVELGTGNVRATELFKVVGEIEPYAEVSQARAEEEDRRCAGAGPVIPAGADDSGPAPFFDYGGPIDRVTALLVLQQAIGEAREGRYRNVGCRPSGALCRDPPALLGGLDLSSLLSVSAFPPGPDGLSRIGASFLISRGTARREAWTVIVEAELEPEGTLDSIRRLGRTEMARLTTVSAGSP